MTLNPPDIRELRAIVDWVNVTDDIRELSIKYGDVELFISRNRTSASSPPAPVAAAPVAPAPVAAAPAPATAPEPAPAPATVATFPPASTPHAVGELAANEVLIKSPMVGVFYAAPKPGDPPFVKVGDKVTASSVLGIVEVMKLMNSIEAQVDGTVTRILVENEKSVEFGQPLMVITRDA